MGAPHFILRFISRSLVVCSVWPAGPAWADTFVGGRIIDAITKQPVAAADVYVEYSSQKVGSGKSNIDGIYKVPFAVPTTAPVVTFVTVTASSGSHGPETLNLQVSGGQSAPALNIELYPTGLLECRHKSDHSVIIGNFLPPAPSGTLSDLSRRIAKSLEFSLKTRLQAVHLTLAKQPSFEPCEVAKPTTTNLGTKYAKALGADAFVDGDVAHNAASGYSVNFYVSDAYDFFADPQIASNTTVDLNTPSGASVSDVTHVAVLTSIAAGLANKSDCITAIKVLAVADQLVDPPLSYVADLRKECEARIPNIGLRRDTQ